MGKFMVTMLFRRRRSPSNNTSKVPATGSASVRKGKRLLTAAQKELYKLETTENFRWVAKLKLVAIRSSHVLSSADFTPAKLQQEFARVGEFAEVVCGVNPIAVIWDHLDLLKRTNFPLEEYKALCKSSLVSVLHGECADVKGGIFYVPDNQQLIIGFSGTCNLWQGLHDIDARKTRYPPSKDGNAKVHRGFWRLYRGIRHVALTAFSEALKRDLPIREVIVTGHSMGATLATFFTLDILSASSQFNTQAMSPDSLPKDVSLKLYHFGSPRLGDGAFSDLFSSAVKAFRDERGVDKFTAHSLELHNDGVPALPPRFFGYCHLPIPQYYTHHGQLYYIPETERECTVFSVNHDEAGYDVSTIDFPRGGHNYYNNRSMERLGRRIGWLLIDESGKLKDGWEEEYLRRFELESRIKDENQNLKSSRTVFAGKD